jgi:hypothetical protein
MMAKIKRGAIIKHEISKLKEKKNENIASE